MEPSSQRTELKSLFFPLRTAIWLMPTTSVYGNWPRSGEIDVMEARGLFEIIEQNNQFNTFLFTSSLSVLRKL
jgi:hypothetical protein